MDPIGPALAAWLAFHASLGVDMPALLLPGATEAEIVAVEQAIGHDLPADLRALYERVDGQLDPWDSDAFDPSSYGGERIANLFGHFRFLPLDEALAEYRSQLEMHATYPEDTAYEPWGYRPEDPIDPVDWQPTWFTFAGADAGNGYAVDLAPPRGGTIGQIVQVGTDFERRVVASSLSDLMSRAAAGLDPNQPGRMEWSDGEDGPMPGSVWFDMDPTWIPPVPPSAEEQALAQAESDAWNVAYRADRDAFVTWLVDSGTAGASAEVVADTVSTSGIYAFGPAPSDEARWGGTEIDDLPGAIDMELYQRMLGAVPGEADLGTSVRAFDALARWRRDSGAWTLAQFEALERVLAKPRELPPGVDLLGTGEVSGAFGSMYADENGVVTIEDTRLSRPIRFDEDGAPLPPLP